ncbi:MAG: RNA 2',3'-cyclic phosphodiesterase [Pirellulaceae bacterium]
MYTTRCFVAVPLGPPASSVTKRLIGRWQGTLEDVKWTRADQLHVTLKFLGELDNRDLLRVSEELQRACESIEPFTASLNGLGTFPRNKPAKVIWARVDEGSDILQQLYQHLDQALVEIGVPQDGKAYSPHVTLGRVGRTTDLDQLAQAMQAAEAEVQTMFDVDHVVVFASLREKGGIVYEPIETVAL